MRRFNKINEASWDDEYSDSSSSAGCGGTKSTGCGDDSSSGSKKSKYQQDYADFIKQKEMKKEKKEKKVFSVGDVVVCINDKAGKLPPDAVEYLRTFKKFTILDINGALNIDIGYKTSDGKTFYYSPNRFELKDKPKDKPEEFRVVDSKKKEKKESGWLERLKEERRKAEKKSYDDWSNMSDKPRLGC
jgi:hypothetical protein